ncbi:sensor histidine kinase [Thalassiella azotivora]
MRRLVPRLADTPQALLRGLDVLLAGLVVLAVLQAPAPSRGPAAALAAALLLGHAAVRRRLAVHDGAVDAPRGAWWPDVAAVGALVGLWSALLAVSGAALWAAFPLMLLTVHTLGPRRGGAVVAVTTAVCVAHGVLRSPDHGPVLGYVLGPVLGALVAVGFVLGLEAIVRESQARQRALDELGVARTHLAEAERARLVATERERLAREIHDTLAQGLSAIELLLRAAGTTVGSDDARTAALLGRARAAAQDDLAEVRRVVRALAPQELTRSSLVEALTRVADRASTGTLTVRVRTVGEARPLAVALEATLLRVAQSAVANVVQHAGATRAHVTLTFTDEHVLLDVVDDGRGFDPDAPPAPAGGGFGLVAMRSRVRELAGSLCVESSPGGGTAVAVTLPAPEPVDVAPARPAVAAGGGPA